MSRLEIPAALYGTQKEVAARAREMVKRVGQGDSLAAVVGSEFLDPTAVSGLVLTRRSRVLAQVPSVHSYAPLHQIELAVLEKRFPDELLDRVFREALATSWGLLALTCHENQLWLFPRARHLPFWEKAIEWWHILDGVGPRYTFGTTPGERLWSVPNNLHYVAVHVGVPIDDVKKPLPPGGLAALDARRVPPPSSANQ
jgi:hypothetical protein